MKEYISLLLVTLAEATIGVFVKLSGDGIPIFTLNFYRVFFAFLFLMIVLPFVSKDFLNIDKKDFKPIMIIGLLIALQISFFNIAMSLAPIANVVIFWSVAPFFVFIFSTIFLKEKVRKQHVFIFLIAFIGILIAKPLSGEGALGNVIALFDGAIYAALVTYMRHQGKTDSVNHVAWYMFMACIYLSPALFIFGFGDVAGLSYYQGLGMYVPTIVWVACLGMISTGVAYFFISLVLKKINASVYSLVDIIVSPIVAAFFGYLIFNEVPHKNMIYGAALLLLSGFWLSNYMSGKKSHWYDRIINKFTKKEALVDGDNPLVENRQVK